MEIWDLRCSFSSISTSPFLLLRIKPGAGKSRWLDNAWLVMSLSADCPSAKCLFLSACWGKINELYKFSWSWRTQTCSWVTRGFYHLRMISSTKCWFSVEQPAVREVLLIPKATLLPQSIPGWPPLKALARSRTPAGRTSGFGFGLLIVHTISS